MGDKLRIRGSALCIEGGRILCVKLVDPKSQTIYWMPPGGSIEAGETIAETAVRETREETGYLISLDAASATTVDYIFSWAGLEVPCRTTFFLATPVEFLGQPAALDPYHHGHAWLPIPEFLKAMKFHPQLSAHLTIMLKTSKP